MDTKTARELTQEVQDFLDDDGLDSESLAGYAPYIPAPVPANDPLVPPSRRPKPRSPLKRIKLRDKGRGEIGLTLRKGVVVGATGSEPQRFMGLTEAGARRLAAGRKAKAKAKAKKRTAKSRKAKTRKPQKKGVKAKAKTKAKVKSRSVRHKK